MNKKLREYHFYYTYQISWSERDKEYVGTCLEFPSVSRLALTQFKALDLIVATIRDVTYDMIHNNESLPEPLCTKRNQEKK